MPPITSHAGTKLDHGKTGAGPAVVLLYVGPFTRAANTGLAHPLAEQFTVYSYDRRRRSGSVHDDPDRKFEDLRAVLTEADGSTRHYGNSGAAACRPVFAGGRGASDRLCKCMRDSKVMAAQLGGQELRHSS